MQTFDMRAASVKHLLSSVDVHVCMQLCMHVCVCICECIVEVKYWFGFY